MIGWAIAVQQRSSLPVELPRLHGDFAETQLCRGGASRTTAGGRNVECVSTEVQEPQYPTRKIEFEFELGSDLGSGLRNVFEFVFQLTKCERDLKLAFSPMHLTAHQSCIDRVFA